MKGLRSALREAARLAFEGVWLTWERHSIHTLLSFRAWTQLEFGRVIRGQRRGLMVA